MLSPKFRENTNPILDPVAWAAGPDALKNNFNTAIANMRFLARNLRDQSHTSGRGGKLTVRFYTNTPTVSLTVKDAETTHGKMHVEIVPHQIPQGPFRPILNIERQRTAAFLLSCIAAIESFRITWPQ